MRAGPPPSFEASSASSSSTFASNAAISRLRACQQQKGASAADAHPARSSHTSTVSAVACPSSSRATMSSVTAAIAALVSPRLGCCMHRLRSTCSRAGVSQAQAAERHSHRLPVPSTTCLIFLQAPALQPGAFELGLEDLYVFQSLWIQEASHSQCGGKQRAAGGPHTCAIPCSSLSCCCAYSACSRLLAPHTVTALDNCARGRWGLSFPLGAPGPRPHGRAWNSNSASSRSSWACSFATPARSTPFSAAVARATNLATWRRHVRQAPPGAAAHA
jgi:hypothetical protein